MDMVMVYDSTVLTKQKIIISIKELHVACSYQIIATSLKHYHSYSDQTNWILAASTSFFIAFYSLWPCQCKSAWLVYCTKEYCFATKTRSDRHLQVVNAAWVKAILKTLFCYIYPSQWSETKLHWSYSYSYLIFGPSTLDRGISAQQIRC